MVIVKTVLVLNLFSNSRSCSLKSYIAFPLSRDPLDCILNDGAIMLGTVCFSEYGSICRVSMLAAPPTDSWRSEYWQS